MVYLMYDVQPVDSTGWQVGGFDGAVVDHPLGKVLMARGATNQKGPERTFLNALEAIIATRGRLPVNLMVTAEGEEEISSIHFPEIAARYERRLRTASGVIFPFPSQSPDGLIGVNLGVKGIVYFELEARGDSAGGPSRPTRSGACSTGWWSSGPARSRAPERGFYVDLLSALAEAS